MTAETGDRPKRQERGWLKPAILVGVIVLVIVLLRVTGVTDYFSRENIGKLEAAIEALGLWAPLVYMVLYIAACLFFIPGLPITIIAGVFGAIEGTIYVSIGSTIGASLAFLVARYAMRPMVAQWAENNPTFRRIDNGVKEHGWRMVMITRLVPIFPFNLQNYAYGLTKVPFWTYVLVSWICMLPGTIAYVFAGGSIISGKGDIRKTLGYLAVAAIFFVLLSFLPRLIKKKYQVEPVAGNNGVKEEVQA